jgi:hypothetical protein
MSQIKRFLEVLEECGSLDAAYERKAIDDGLVKVAVFPENKQYLEEYLKLCTKYHSEN